MPCCYLWSGLCLHDLQYSRYRDLLLRDGSIRSALENTMYLIAVLSKTGKFDDIWIWQGVSCTGMSFMTLCTKGQLKRARIQCCARKQHRRSIRMVVWRATASLASNNWKPAHLEYRALEFVPLDHLPRAWCINVVYVSFLPLGWASNGPRWDERGEV